MCLLLLDINLFFIIIFERFIYEGCFKFMWIEFVNGSFINFYVFFYYFFVNNIEKIRLFVLFIYFGKKK